MAEKNDTTHVLVPHTLLVFVRPRSTVWQCRYQVDGKWQRESTNERNLDNAKRVAHDLLIEANGSQANTSDFCMIYEKYEHLTLI